jgi:hypothetical protein
MRAVEAALVAIFPLQLLSTSTGNKGRRTTRSIRRIPNVVPSPPEDRESSTGWVTVTGVSATGGASLNYPARYDSVTWSVLGGLYLSAAKGSMIARNQLTGTIGVMANDGRACYSGTAFDPGCFANSESDTMRGNAIDLGIMSPGARHPAARPHAAVPDRFQPGHRRLRQPGFHVGRRRGRTVVLQHVIHHFPLEPLDVRGDLGPQLVVTDVERIRPA